MRALLLSVALLIAAPATAGATLVFDREPLKPAVWIAADDGGHAHKLAAGSQPRVAPDGRAVAFLRIARSQDAGGLQLMVVPADGSAPPRVLLRDWDGLLAFAWSPDSRTIATAVGRDGNAPKRLVLVDVATGAARTVARGFFEGASFAPDGTALVYSRHLRNDWPPRADVWRVPVAGCAPAGAPVRMTTGHDAVAPLWGPTGTIVVTRLVDAKRRKYGPKGELYVMPAAGGPLRRLTTTKVDPLLFGLTATQWSADGTRLLAQFSGQDTSYAERVDPATGRHHPILRAEEGGLQATRLSRDGTTVLGATGGFDPGGRHDVVTVPYAGGTPTVLARNAFNPDWDR
jgi:Tol biopolymer transport system component